jgi:hypothetical protein
MANHVNAHESHIMNNESISCLNSSSQQMNVMSCDVSQFFSSDAII